MIGSEVLLRELEAIQTRNAVTNDYQKTLAMLRALKSGLITLKEIELTADGWRLIEPARSTETADKPFAEEATKDAA